MAVRLHVLLIEDSPQDAALLLRELRRSGYEPASLRVDTAEAMAAALAAQPWDVIISDHAMPRFSATDALAVLSGAGMDIPLIIVSGIMTEEAAVEAMRAGAHDYLHKDSLARLGPAVARELEEAADRQARRQAELALAAEQLRAKLAEQLYAEINHRMKNNLMMLAGVLEMQAYALPAGSPAAGALRDAVTRVAALSAVHEHLYEGKPGDVELRDVIGRIGQMDVEALAATGVEFAVTGDEVHVPSKLGSTLAIVTNELITNALKYGAAGANGRRRIEVTVRRRDGGISLAVWNSGNPVPTDFDLAAHRGMGLELVLAVVSEQLRGHFTMVPREGGTLAELAIAEAVLAEPVPAL
jgi:two-component sensor histidine kinase